MKKIKTIIISAFFIFSGMTASAQQKAIWNVQYDMGFGLENTRDFINSGSFRGLSVEGRRFVGEHITIGGRYGWQTFYKNVGEVTRIAGTRTITGYNKRYINVMPLMVTAHYYFTTSKIYSYVGVGLGTYYMNIRDQIGMYYSEDKSWRFGVSPDLGIVVPVGKNVGFTANVHYNYAAKTKYHKLQSWIGIGLGFSYIF